MSQPIQQHLTKLLSIVFILFCYSIGAQITIRGEVYNENGGPIENAKIVFNLTSAFTDSYGKFSLDLDEKEGTILVEKEGYQPYEGEIVEGQTNYIFFLKIAANSEGVEIPIIELGTNPIANSISINPEDLDKLPTFTGGPEQMLPFVSIQNEMSSQFQVRGGNYDENLIYVNGIEIYRPQLIRSGQQEGLSFLNNDMIQSINFTAGGFEAQYGDKMSSALDITYRTPKKFEASVEASLLGGSVAVGGVNKKENLSILVGARYLNRNLILNTLDGETDFDPRYLDIQSNIQYQINRKWQLNFIGLYSNNQFDLVPENRETDFGTLNQPLRLTVFYDGQENDQFNTTFGALGTQFKPNYNWTLDLNAFAYHSNEQEYYDIDGAYFISEVDPSTGESFGSFDVGRQLDHARNDLDLLVAGIQHRGKYKFSINESLEWGLKFQIEDIRDRLEEYQLIDSTGFSLPANNGNLELFYALSAQNELQSERYSGFVQYQKNFLWNKTKVALVGGVRATYWSFNQEMNISPRMQIGFIPNWKTQMHFRFSTGYYYQPPFYKEIRGFDGKINPNVASQESIHFILGNDYFFQMFNRKKKFKLTTEAYYKIMNNLIPYFIDNVRIRYTAENNSKGYTYGLDSRLSGEFVPGVESWVSVSYSRTKENIENRGFISRPSDQRFTASLFFQDYMPMLPSFKAYVKLVYSSGLPNGAPFRADPYSFQTFLPDYRRVDIGLVKEFINQTDLKPASDFWSHFKELSIGLELFNVFNIRNTISNQWVRDVNTSQIYAVPNRLTGFLPNVKIWMKF